MRLRPLAVLGTVALILLAGCAPEPTPTRTPTPSASPSPTATPTPEPVVAPETAFDVTCEGVAAEMTALVGAPAAPVAPVLTTVGASNWIPGPAQHMFQRAGGIACSTGDDPQYWEVVLVPGAPAIIEGATERQGYFGEQARCENDGCYFELVDGDVLLTATVRQPGVGAADVARFDETMRRLAATASATLREVDYVDSDIVGAPCERFLTEADVNSIAGVGDARLVTRFGGWGIPSEVYQVVNGSRICHYSGEGGEYGTSYATVTTLPAGAWAYEAQEGTSVDVPGADAAKQSAGPYGMRYLDLLVGPDWVRVTTFEDGSGSASVDPAPLAERLVRNLTVGPTAPQ